MANYISAIKLPNGDIYQLKDKNALPLTGGTVTGPTSFNDSVDIDDLNVDTLLVNGNATLVNGVQIGGNTQVDKINGVTVGNSPKFTDTTYTFDGTYNASSNKAATVQTVTNAINNLDVTAKTGTTSQTITSISQTNGKIDVTYSNISITKSQVSNFPTSWDLSNISGADDLKKIEALTGTSGFLKKTAANTWSLDTTSYAPTTRKVNGHALSSDVTVTKGDVGLGNVTNYQQITGIGQGANGTLRVWTGDPTSTSTDDYEDIAITITAYNQSTVSKAGALNLSAAVGSTSKPVYFKADGKPYEISYTIEKSVPSNAVFTDTWKKVSTSQDGYVTKLPGNTTSFLRGDGTWATPPDTTYTFDGTYNSSTNKVATVNTVTNAINNLDGNLNNTTPGAGKTLTAFSQTNGKISATFGNISITKSQISDFPTSLTPTSHTHGNIQNGGTLQTNDITIGSGDKLIVTDYSDSNKIARSSVSFDGSTKTQALTKAGTWETFNNYSLPLAANGTRGGVQIGYTTSGKNYAVQLSSEKMYVNVPWTDTTYSAGTGLSLNGTTFNHSNSITAGTAGTSSATSSTNRTIAVPYITYDAQGHVTGSGTHTHTLDSFPEAYLAWGGKNFSASYGPIDAAMIPQLGANRFAFLKAVGLDIEYSIDGGESWSDYGAANDQKVGLFSTSGDFYLGKAATKANNNINNMLRVTITTNLASIYTTLNKIAIYMTTRGNSTFVKIERATQGDPTNFITHLDWVGIEGWSGWNILNIDDLTTYGNTAAQNQKVRFIFKQTSVNANDSSPGIWCIYGFGGVGWTVPSNMAKTGHLYSYDSNQNATFPAQVTATQFNGSLNGININAVVDSFNTGGWSKLNGLLNDSVISVGQNRSMADWNGYAYSSSLVFGCRDTKGLLDMAYSVPMVTFGGTNIAQATEDRPKWYFKLLGTSDKIYTLPSDSKTLAATDGSNATGTWDISISGTAATATQDKNGNDITTTYLPLTGGTLSGKLTVGTTSQSAAPTGAIHVHDIRNYTIPTTMLSSGVNWFFTLKGTPTWKYWSGMHINGWTGDYNAWELIGPSHDEDQRTTPLYVRSGRTTHGWGDWRKIYDSSNVPTKSEIGLGNVENTALSTWTGSNKITTVGTISSGTWNGTVIGVSHGGTGASSFTANSLIMSGSTTTAALTTRAIATSIASNSTSTAIPTSSAVATLVASNKQGTLTFTMDTNDTKKLIITYSH